MADKTDRLKNAGNHALFRATMGRSRTTHLSVAASISDPTASVGNDRILEMDKAKFPPVLQPNGLPEHTWQGIHRELFSKRLPGPSRNEKAMRKFVEATLWVACSKMRWADMPSGYGNWHSIYVRFTRWATTGRWTRFIQALQRHGEAAMAHHLSLLVASYQYRHMVRNMRQQALAEKDQQLDTGSI